MVKKLFKHEFLAWFRVMAVVYAVMLSVSALMRLFQCFESDSPVYLVVSVLAIFLFIMLLVVCIAFCEIFGVVRFYKNLFTGEGYLSFTLPVTAGQHLWVKALTAGAMLLLTLLVATLSVVIVSAGDLLTEGGKAAAYLLRQLPPEAQGHAIGYGLESLFLLLAGCVFGPMLYYACICIGQTFRKHRILGAIGVYFGYYYICQILSGILTGVLAAISTVGADDAVVELTGFPYGAFHVLLGGGVLWTVGVGMIYFAVCHHIITKKLNLE